VELERTKNNKIKKKKGKEKKKKGKQIVF